MLRLTMTALVSMALLTGARVHAQLDCTVGPAIAPIGGEIAIAIANDTPNTYATVVCPFIVRDVNGNVVYAPTCNSFAIPYIFPGDVQVALWQQNDQGFAQVPPGTYFIDVIMPDGTIPTRTVTITNVPAGIVELGPVRPGTTRPIYLVSPNDSFGTYAAGAAFTSITGIATCAGVVPLDNDVLLTLSTTPGNAYFTDFSGTLDFYGKTFDPRITIPLVPALSGFSIQLAFVTVDFTAACPIPTISPAYTLTIQ